jgi:hypothetical protein
MHKGVDECPNEVHELLTVYVIAAAAKNCNRMLLMVAKKDIPDPVTSPVTVVPIGQINDVASASQGGHQSHPVRDD